MRISGLFRALPRLSWTETGGTYLKQDWAKINGKKEKSRMRKFTALMTAVLLVAATAGCSFAAGAFKIGGTGPLTGGYLR